MKSASPRRLANRWLGPVVGVYWLIAFSGTHLPGNALPTRPWGDKLDHMAGYLILGLLLCLWLGLSRPWIRYAPLWALALAIAYGALDEITQPIVYRVADVGDWIADSIGATVGVALGSTVVFLIRRRRNTQCDGG
ncbi:MAG TPA: VanZ family protein [Tepidisphaeraceae bacterium]|nr:VanZ family protein [Tepidisphaeraceae bacterium]